MWGTVLIFVFIFICILITQTGLLLVRREGMKEDEDEEKDEEVDRPLGAGSYEGGILGILGSIGFLLGA